MLCCRRDDSDWQPLNRRQRRARLIAGLIMLLLMLGLLSWSGPVALVLAVLLGWLGATHVLTAATAYPGCPELGAVPSLFLGRWVRIGCTPWCWLDAKLKLKDGD